MINTILNQNKNQNTKKKIVIVKGVEKNKQKTKNKNIKEVALKNKIGQQKLTCVDCDSKKSSFSERIKNKK